MRWCLSLVICLLIIPGCIWNWPRPGQGQNGYAKVMGYIPIYSTNQSLKIVQSDTPRNVTNAGKIYAYQNYFLQCEVGEGIHVIDNSIPSAAKRIVFIKAKGANEISIKGNFLYTNSYKDLLIIDISNLTSVREVKRIPNAFLVDGYLPKPPGRGYYECVDVSKGIVTDWKKDSISYTGCYN